MSHDLVIEDLTVSYHRIPAVHHLNLSLKRLVRWLDRTQWRGKDHPAPSPCGPAPLETGRVRFQGRELSDGRLITYVPQRETVDWDFPHYRARTCGDGSLFGAWGLENLWRAR